MSKNCNEYYFKYEPSKLILQTQERMLLLIPEFCYLTGISDAMRSDFRIMKDIHGITSLNPTGRRDVIRKFVQKVKETEVTRELLAGWGLRLEDDTIKLTGRALDPETLIFGKGKTMSAGNKASWPAATKMPILRTVSIYLYSSLKYLLMCR